MEKEPKRLSFKEIPVSGFGIVISGLGKRAELGLERDKVYSIGDAVKDLTTFSGEYYFQKIVLPGLDGQEIEVMSGVILGLKGLKIIVRGLSTSDFIPEGEVLVEPIRVETANP